MNENQETSSIEETGGETETKKKANKVSLTLTSLMTLLGAGSLTTGLAIGISPNSKPDYDITENSVVATDNDITYDINIKELRDDEDLVLTLTDGSFKESVEIVDTNIKGMFDDLKYETKYTLEITGNKTYFSKEYKTTSHALSSGVVNMRYESKSTSDGYLYIKLKYFDDFNYYSNLEMFFYDDLENYYYFDINDKITDWQKVYIREALGGEYTFAVYADTIDPNDTIDGINNKCIFEAIIII